MNQPLPKLDAPAEEIAVTFKRLLAEKSARARTEAASRGDYSGFAPVGYLNRSKSGVSSVILDPLLLHLFVKPSNWRRKTPR